MPDMVGIAHPVAIDWERVSTQCLGEALQRFREILVPA